MSGKQNWNPEKLGYPLVYHNIRLFVMSQKKGSAPCWTTALGFQAMTQCRSFKLSSSKPAEAAFPTRSASWRPRLPVPEGWPFPFVDYHLPALSYQRRMRLRRVLVSSRSRFSQRTFLPCVWGAGWSCIKVAKCWSIMTLGGTVGVINGYNHVYNPTSWDVIPTTNMVPYHLITGHLQVGIYIYILNTHTHIYIYTEI